MAVLFLTLFITSLSLDELIEIAVGSNPILLSAKEKYSASLFSQKYSNSIPNPRLGIGYSISREKPEFLFEQEIPFPKKLEKLKKISLSKSEIEKEYIEVLKHEIIAELKKSFFEIWFLKNQKEIIEKTKELLSQIVESAEAKYRVGTENLPSLLESYLELSKLDEKLIMLSNEIVSASAKMKQIVGDIDIESIDFEKDAYPLKIDANIKELESLALSNSPYIRYELANVNYLTAVLESEKASYFPDSSVMFDTMGGMPRVMLTFTIPAYFWWKESNKVSESQKILTSQKQKLEDTKREIIYLLRTFKSSSDSSFELWNLYSNRILPQAEASFESSRSNWIAGKTDFIHVITNLITLLNYKIEEKKQIYLNRKYNAEIERLLGMTEKEVINRAR